MTGTGSVKRVFPGANTPQGFFSFYDHIIGPEAERIFVLKGGPGVGKSTFMRRIAESMRETGCDVELHCCSSDNGSLDGVVIPGIGVALIDGTAPHRAATNIDAACESFPDGAKGFSSSPEKLDLFHLIGKRDDRHGETRHNQTTTGRFFFTGLAR